MPDSLNIVEKTVSGEVFIFIGEPSIVAGVGRSLPLPIRRFTQINRARGQKKRPVPERLRDQRSPLFIYCAYLVKKFNLKILTPACMAVPEGPE